MASVPLMFQFSMCLTTWSRHVTADISVTATNPLMVSGIIETALTRACVILLQIFCSLLCTGLQENLICKCKLQSTYFHHLCRCIIQGVLGRARNIYEGPPWKPQIC